MRRPFDRQELPPRLARGLLWREQSSAVFGPRKPPWDAFEPASAEELRAIDTMRFGSVRVAATVLFVLVADASCGADVVGT